MSIPNSFTLSLKLFSQAVSSLLMDWLPADGLLVTGTLISVQLAQLWVDLQCLLLTSSGQTPRCSTPLLYPAALQECSDHHSLSPVLFSGWTPPRGAGGQIVSSWALQLALPWHVSCVCSSARNPASGSQSIRTTLRRRGKKALGLLKAMWIPSLLQISSSPWETLIFTLELTLGRRDGLAIVKAKT